MSTVVAPARALFGSCLPRAHLKHPARSARLSLLTRIQRAPLLPPSLSLRLLAPLAVANISDDGSSGGGINVHTAYIVGSDTRLNAGFVPASDTFVVRQRTGAASARPSRVLYPCRHSPLRGAETARSRRRS